MREHRLTTGVRFPAFRAREGRMCFQEEVPAERPEPGGLRENPDAIIQNLNQRVAQLEKQLGQQQRMSSGLDDPRVAALWQTLGWPPDRNAYRAPTLPSGLRRSSGAQRRGSQRPWQQMGEGRNLPVDHPMANTNHAGAYNRVGLADGRQESRDEGLGRGRPTIQDVQAYNHEAMLQNAGATRIVNPDGSVSYDSTGVRSAGAGYADSLQYELGNLRNPEKFQRLNDLMKELAGYYPDLGVRLQNMYDEQYAEFQPIMRLARSHPETYSARLEGFLQKFGTIKELYLQREDMMGAGERLGEVLDSYHLSEEKLKAEHEFHIETPDGNTVRLNINGLQWSIDNPERGEDANIFVRFQEFRRTGKLKGAEICFTKPGLYRIDGMAFPVGEEGQSQLKQAQQPVDITKAQYVLAYDFSGRGREPTSLQFSLVNSPENVVHTIQLASVPSGGSLAIDGGTIVVSRKPNGRVEVAVMEDAKYVVKGIYMQSNGRQIVAPLQSVTDVAGIQDAVRRSAPDFVSPEQNLKNLQQESVGWAKRLNEEIVRYNELMNDPKRDAATIKEYLGDMLEAVTLYQDALLAEQRALNEALGQKTEARTFARKQVVEADLKTVGKNMAIIQRLLDSQPQPQAEEPEKPERTA